MTSGEIFHLSEEGFASHVEIAKMVFALDVTSFGPGRENPPTRVELGRGGAFKRLMNKVRV